MTNLKLRRSFGSGTSIIHVLGRFNSAKSTAMTKEYNDDYK